MDRDAQFQYINDQAMAFLAAGQPVISVDTKKKELVGNFKNNGREYRPKATPETVNVHDFIDPKLGRAVPYGVYDIADNKGWVSVGTDHDTASFAVHAIERWWHDPGTNALSKSQPSDDHRRWRRQQRTPRPSMESRTANLGQCAPPSHHGLPSAARHQQMEQNRTSPLFLYHAQLARKAPAQLQNHRPADRGTTTTTGLTVRAELDKNKYPKGGKTSDAQLAAINLTRHDFHGDWNYTIQAAMS